MPLTQNNGLTPDVTTKSDKWTTVQPKFTVSPNSTDWVNFEVIATSEGSVARWRKTFMLKREGSADVDCVGVGLVDIIKPYKDEAAYAWEIRVVCEGPEAYLQVKGVNNTIIQWYVAGDWYGMSTK